MAKVPLGTLGTVQFSTGLTVGVVSDYDEGKERDLLVTLFPNTASAADGYGDATAYPTKVGDQVSDFKPFS